MIRDASFIKAAENFRSATTRERTSSTTTGTRTGVSGEFSIICLWLVTPTPKERSQEAPLLAAGRMSLYNGCAYIK